MSSSSSSEVISESENSECSDFEQEMEEELMENTDQSKVGKYSSEYLSSSEEEYAYRNDPIADEEWTARYEAEMAEERNLDEMLTRRLNGSIPVSEWCTCGNCNTSLLQNPNECYCCQEQEGCVEELNSVLVKKDIGEETKLQCITDHPGFASICLEKWSLRMASSHYKTTTKGKYTQMESEERFLRSVSYREFCRLVYGIMGKVRKPLPSCAYTLIRKKFPAEKDESYTGFELDED